MTVRRGTSALHIACGWCCFKGSLRLCVSSQEPGASFDVGGAGSSLWTRSRGTNRAERARVPREPVQVKTSAWLCLPAICTFRLPRVSPWSTCLDGDGVKSSVTSRNLAR